MRAHCQMHDPKIGTFADGNNREPTTTNAVQPPNAKPTIVRTQQQHKSHDSINVGKQAEEGQSYSYTPNVISGVGSTQKIHHDDFRSTRYHLELTWLDISKHVPTSTAASRVLST